MRGQNALAALFILINAHLSVAFDDGLVRTVGTTKWDLDLTPAQSFKFDYKPPGQPFQIPTTEQCETLHIKWDRGDVATGSVGSSPRTPNFVDALSTLYRPDPM